ncbi:6705_t:CDS:2 [Entrophospora sp. SA101]|nr:6705_t:CDS:2 [Entrophospora sp. SA101]
MIKPPYKHSLHLYRHTLRYIRSSSLPFPYLRSKLHYNTRELFEIYRDEQDENKITEKMVDKGKRKLYETSTGTSSATNKIKISDWSSFITSENYQNTLSRVDSETFIEVVTKRIKNIENKDDLLNDILDFVPENGFIVAKLK